MATVDELLQAFRVRREGSAKELAALLGVSQPTLSRLIRSAGDRLCRLGRARSTTYARTRSLPGLGTRIPIRRVDETGSVHRVGTLHFLADGSHYFKKEDGRAERFAGLPPFAVDMAPQGFLGHGFSQRFSELGLPTRIVDWSDDQRLIALARRGEDCVGDLILGDESFSRFLQIQPEVFRVDFPLLVERSLQAEVGSSAGGEWPKFTAFVDGEHRIVKFVTGERGRATTRRRDLLAAEALALAVLSEAGIPVAVVECFDRGPIRFLEAKRFDRIGANGRRGILSLLALAGEYLGHLDDWTTAANDLFVQNRISVDEARTMRWLDTFGQLIANNDRHFGNLSFFVAADGSLRLAPIYDMLPMLFVPVGSNLVEQSFTPRPPDARNFDVWHEAARWAIVFWRRLGKLKTVSKGFRELSGRCGERVERLRERVPTG